MTIPDSFANNMASSCVAFGLFIAHYLLLCAYNIFVADRFSCVKYANLKNFKLYSVNNLQYLQRYVVYTTYLYPRRGLECEGIEASPVEKG